MIRSVAISSDPGLTEQLKAALAENPGYVEIVKTLDRYSSIQEVLLLLRQQSPRLLFLSMDSIPEGLDLVTMIRNQFPAVQIVGFDRTFNSDIVLRAMRSGVCDYLSPPFTASAIAEAIKRVEHMLEDKPSLKASRGKVYSFLPSKPGVGTSTLAVNAACSAAKIAATRVLLTDFDLSSSMVRFLLKLPMTHNVEEALDHAQHLDETMWRQLVSTVAKLDVLHAGELKPNIRIETDRLHLFMEFARRQYDLVCIDLSGNLEKYSIEIMKESRAIFLVCTPEISSLHMGKEKLTYLRTLGLGDQVKILLSRETKQSAMSVEEIEESFGAPVLFRFPNDYAGVQNALQAAKPMEASTPIGKEVKKLSRWMTGEPQAAEANPPKSGIFRYLSGLLPDRRPKL